MTSPRASFRPMRPAGSAPRASLPASLPASLNKENNTLAASAATNNTAPTLNRGKKRAQSLGGSALDDLRNMQEAELSPRKKARRSLVPGRSILKPALAETQHAHTTSFMPAPTNLQRFVNHNQTTDLSNLPSTRQPKEDQFDEESSDDSDDEVELRLTNATGFDDDRRKSLARRVSFAATAHVRTYETDTAEHLTASSPSVADNSFTSSNGSEESPSRSAGQQSFASNHSEEGEDSMEMADPDNITSAFAGHFQGTYVPPPPPANLLDSDDDEDEAIRAELASQQQNSQEDTQEMDLAVSDEVTAAFNSHATAVFNSQQHQQHRQQPSPAKVERRKSMSPRKSLAFPVPQLQQPPPAASKPKPRPSEVVRWEEREDEEIMKELSVAQSQSQSLEEEDEDTIRDDEPDDEEEDMDMTVPLGQIVASQQQRRASLAAPAPASEAASVMDESMMENEEDQSVTMDLTVPLGNIVLTQSQQLNEEGVITRDGMRIIPTPTTPSARLRASLGKSPEKPQLGSLQSPAKPAPGAAQRQSQPPRYIDNSSPRRAVPLHPTINAAKSPKRLHGPSPLALSSPATPRAKSRTKQLTGFPSPSSLAKPTKDTRVPFGVQSPSRRGIMWDDAAVAESKNARRDSDMTNSSLGTYISEDQGEGMMMKMGITEFLREAKVTFDEDSLALAGKDLKHHGRKSMGAGMKIDRPETGPPTFTDYVVFGACKTLFHELYTRERGVIQDQLSELEQIAQVHEHAVQQATPTIFLEWAQADDRRRAELMRQFRMMKGMLYTRQKTQWNDFRAQNYQIIVQAMEENLAGVMQDIEVVNSTDMEDSIAALQRRKEALKAELHAERLRDVELSACDQDQLEDIRLAVREQGAQVDDFAREHREVSGQLSRLTVKANELVSRKTALSDEVEDLRRSLEEGRFFTKTEVSRLRDEFAALQAIHGWTLAPLNPNTPNVVTLAFFNEISVTLSLNGDRMVKSVELAHDTNKFARDDLKRDVSGFSFVVLREWAAKAVTDTPTPLRPSYLLNRIAAIWLTARRLRSELAVVRLRYPVSIVMKSRADAKLGRSYFLRSIAEVHVPKARASFNVMFQVTDEDLLKGNPDAMVENISCEVQPQFGEVDKETLVYIVRERSNNGGRWALQEACAEAEAKYA